MPAVPAMAVLSCGEPVVYSAISDFSSQIHFSRAPGPRCGIYQAAGCEALREISVFPRSVIDRPNRAETMHRIKTRLERCRRTVRDFFLITSGSMLVLLPVLLPIVVSVSAPALAQAPGPELFAKEPQTPMELWEAVDYLLRTGQAKKALPYIDKFMKAKPDAATWIAIRNRFGPGSILRLSDDPLTQTFAQALVGSHAGGFAHVNHNGPSESLDTLQHSTERGPSNSTPFDDSGKPGRLPFRFLVKALKQPGLSAENRQQIVDNMGELGPLGCSASGRRARQP